MADLILNVDFSPPWLRKKKEAGNLKHQTFLRRRRVLEQRGVLKQKQLPVAQPGGCSQKKPGPQGRRGKRPRATGGVLEKPNSIQPKPGPKANGHAAATRPPAATTRPPTAATRTPAAAKQTPTTASRTPTATKRTPAATSPAAASRTPKATNRPPAATTRPPAAVTGSSTAVTRPATATQNGATIPKGTNPKASACGKAKRNQKAPGLPPQPGKMVAIDCEMVGTGPGGRVSDLARCSIVNYHGDVMYDQYIRPTAPIVDYRTRWSGIRRQHMEIAIPFVRAQREILHILSGKIVIGHAIHNDFKALKYFHPKALTRDTSKIPLLNRKGGFPENVSISLKRLAKELLHQDIQVGKSGHSSVEDARATMELYKVVEAEWEQHLLMNPEQE